MDLYGELFERVLLPAWEGAIRRRPTLRLRRQLELTERLPLEELEALQLGALRRLLRHAVDHVPFYRARFDAAGVRPEEVVSLTDVRRIPILDRGAARASAESRASTAPPLATIRKTTSGSTGEPLAFGYDLGSEHWRQATKLRGYRWAGYRPGMRAIHYWGRSPLPPGLRGAKIRLDRALRRERYVDCSARSDADLERVASALRRAPPEMLVCFAQGGADLARFVNARGGPPLDVPVICAAERLTPADRAAIVQAFGPRVFETYGSREVMLIAAECEAHDGMHVSMENLLVEIVVRDGDIERAAEAGETGEVIVTDLHNFGMPFIRYASGDLAVSRGRAPCSCGRSLARLGPVEGRVAETLVDGAGGRVSGLLVAVAITSLGGPFRAYQVVQRPDRSVTVRLACDRLEPEDARRLRAIIEPYLRGAALALERVDDISLDRSGKRRVVVIER